MGTKTGIEWTDATWNPIRGCTRVSEGCRNCYAERQALRFSGAGQPYEGLAVLKNGHASWTGKITFVEKHLLDPLKWKAGRPLYDAGTVDLDGNAKRVGRDPSQSLRIFVNSMSDLFHENVTDEMRDRIFDVMQDCPHHVFQVLTKRPAAMLRYAEYRAAMCAELRKNADEDDREMASSFVWPLPNVWMGVSVENQAAADERIPLLLQTPAAVRFISAEPLLGMVDLSPWVSKLTDRYPGTAFHEVLPGVPFTMHDKKLDWVICGGESGPGARPMHPDWARSLRDQCTAAGVPFFFKQWGEWAPAAMCTFEQYEGNDNGEFHGGGDFIDGCHCAEGDKTGDMRRIGKHKAGALLDGVEWKQFPGVRA